MSTVQLEASRIDVTGIATALKEAEAKASKPIRRRFTVRSPAGKLSTTWVDVVHKEDPKKVLLDKVGPIPDDLVMFSRLLVAVYQPPIVEKTSGGILMAQSIQDEDREESLWQGKVGLLIKMGEQAYKDDDNIKFHGQRCEVGDWVWFRPSNGDGCTVGSAFCRVFDSERYIIGKLPHPDMVA